MAGINWLPIKTEYINNQISYRKLAKKHDISESTLMQKAVKEKWKAERDKQRSKIEAKSKQKAAEKISDKEAERTIQLVSISSSALEKVKKAIEQSEDDDGNIDTYKLGQAVRTLKDLNDIIASNKSEGIDNNVTVNLNWSR